MSSTAIEEMTATGQWRTVSLYLHERRVALVAAAERLVGVAALPHAAEVVRRAAERARARTAERSGRVLIVDDDAAVARGLARLLSTADGWRPVVVCSYADGWQVLTERWEAVLVDLVLRSSRPETGADLAREALRAGVPRVVLMSGIAGGAELETIRAECGAHAAVAKGELDRATLLAVLRPQAVRPPQAPYDDLT